VTARRAAGVEGVAAPDVERLARILAALADPTRLRIVALVARGERSGVEVAEALGISQALACHHLTRLAECGLVRQRREGQAKYNRLDHDLLARSLGQIAAIRDDRRDGG